MSFRSRLRRLLGSSDNTRSPSCVFSVEMKGHEGKSGTLKRLSPGGEFSQAAIDPEGRRVAYWGCEAGTTEYHLWVADIALHTCARLTKLPGLHGHPAWWPDGNSIVYFSTAGVSNATSWEASNQFNTERPSANLFRINVGTGERTRLTNGDWVDERPAVSPGGDQIVFVSNRSGRLNLWALDTSDHGLQQITQHSDLDYRPAFSPEGDRIAYFTRTEAGSHQLAIVKWPDLTRERIDTGRDFAWAHGPSWCHTSNCLMFHGLRRPEIRPSLWMIDLDSMKVRRLTIPGIKDCSHGSLDRADMTLAFDSREKVGFAQPTILR